MKRERELAAKLLGWFEENARDLPWRRTRDPYAIWISEVMLQQTQVKTVIPYWERWMRSFPSVESLAAAPVEKILKAWEGLGYYSRARQLHRAAGEMVAQYRGQVPATMEGLLSLPGIGRYTAGAISSIAFDRPEPVVDGNVARVLSRLFALAENPRSTVGSERLWQMARRLVEAASSGGTRGAVGRFNEGLMELGATVCLPRNPRCIECPLARRCAARKQGRAEEFPKVPARPATTQRRFIAFVVMNGGRILVRQRPRGIVNGGLWEFPNGETSGCGAAEEVALNVLGVRPRELRFWWRLRHSITRYRMTLEVYVVKSGGRHRGEAGEWHSREELELLAFPTAHRRVVERLGEIAIQG